MAYAGETKKNSTLVSALLILLFAVLIAAVAVFLFFNPWILGELMLIAAIVAGVIVIGAVIVYIIMAILALPYYAAKGESYQTDASYDLDDVEAVREKSSEEDGRH